MKKVYTISTSMKISDEEWGILTMKITLKTILRMSSSYCKCEFC